MPGSLSVVLITLNEAANLPRTLAGIAQLGDVVHEIIVVDSGSTDTTLELARAAGAKVFVEPWRGFGAQKNAAIAHAAGEWVLSLDADEEIGPALAQEMRALLKGEPPLSAYRIPRLNHFLGQPLRHGGYWPDPKLRLFQRGAAQFEERLVHESMQTSATMGQLKSPLLHHCYPTLADYIDHINRYSDAGARMLAEKGRAPRTLPALLWSAVLNPAATFLYNYVVRLGFLDGRAGLLQHLNHAIYIHWKYVKAWELTRRS